MGILGLNLEEAGRGTLKRLSDPFDRFFAPPLDMKGANERNDFKSGFRIMEIVEGVEQKKSEIVLVGDAMPHVPFTFGGSQKIVKDYYPGNSEPSVQVLGGQEDNIVIRGRLKAKRWKPANKQEKTADRANKLLPGIQKTGNATAPPKTGNLDKEKLRQFANEMRELIDAVRIKGNLVRITMGDFRRYGHIEKVKFNLRTLADIDYEISFSIIGVNPPRNCKILGESKTNATDINQKVIKALQKFQEGAYPFIPKTVDRGIADQINDAISDVASAVNLVTDFVDTLLAEYDSIKESVERGVGLVKNGRAKISTYQRQIGSYPAYGTSSTSYTNGISAEYANATYIQGTLSDAFSLTAYLAALAASLKLIAKTEPLARHRVQDSQTLHELAQKYYNDSAQWSIIYDHNKLTSTELVNGIILEIPRI